MVAGEETEGRWTEFVGATVTTAQAQLALQSLVSVLSQPGSDEGLGEISCLEGIKTGDLHPKSHQPD